MERADWLFYYLKLWYPASPRILTVPIFANRRVNGRALGGMHILVPIVAKKRFRNVLFLETAGQPERRALFCHRPSPQLPPASPCFALRANCAWGSTLGEQLAGVDLFRSGRTTVAGGNLRLVVRLLTQIARVLEINDRHTNLVPDFRPV